MEIRNEKDIENYVIKTLEEVSQVVEKGDFKRSEKIMEKRINELKDWFRYLPPTQKEFFKKVYEEGLQYLLAFYQELATRPRRESI